VCLVLTRTTLRPLHLADLQNDLHHTRTVLHSSCGLQVASRTQAVTTSLMQSVVDANKAHQVHLETAAKSQAEATATLLSAVHSGINQVQPQPQHSLVPLCSRHNA